MEDDNNTASKLIEIKEILESLQYNDRVNTNDKRKLRDYITNLQQEKEKWFAVAKDFEMEAHDLWNKNNELEQKLEDYKSRIEKAVEYIKENAWYMNKDNEEILDRIGVEGLLKILEGDNNEKI